MMVYSVLIVCCVTMILCSGKMRKLGSLQITGNGQEFAGILNQDDVMKYGERVHQETAISKNRFENTGYDTMIYGQSDTALDTDISPIPTTVDPIEKAMPHSTKNESDCLDAYSLSTLCTASIDNDKSMHDLFNSVCSSLDTDCCENSILTPESTIQEYQDFTEENLCSQTYALNDLSQVSHDSVDTDCGDYNFISSDGFGSQNTLNDVNTTTISDITDQTMHYDQYECMFSDFSSGNSNSPSRDIITPDSAMSQIADFYTKDTCEASKIDDVVNLGEDSEKVEYLCLPFFSFELYNAMNIFDKLYSTEPRYVSTNHIYLNDGWVQSRSTLPSAETYNSYIYNCIIKLDGSNINYILTGRSREQLYAKVKDPLNNSSMYYIDNRKLNHAKYNTCIFKFIWNLDVENYSYQNLQELYITFIAYTFLDYNDNLKCYVMKASLWDIHTYMTELYFIIMWRLGRLNLEMTDQQPELRYKTNLHRDMKHLCAIVRLYNDIKKLDNQAVDYPKQTSALYFEVDRFRMHILSYLETIYPTDGASTLYYFGYYMRKYNIGQKYLARDVNAKLIPKKLSGLQNQPGIQKRKSELRKRIGGRTNPKYFKYFHHKNLTKYTIYILAFTINFASFTQHQYDINSIKEQAKKMNNKDSITKILYTEFTGDDRNREQINNVIINIIRFLGLVRNKSVVVQGRIAMTDDNISRVLFELDKMINTTRPSKIQEGRRLALYRKYILEAMGICND